MSRLRQLRALRGAEASGAAPDTPEDTPSEIPDWSAMADEAALRGQMRRRLALAVRSLPPIYRGPVILRDVRGLSTEEASSALHLSDETLKSGSIAGGGCCGASSRTSPKGSACTARCREREDDVLDVPAEDAGKMSRQTVLNRSLIDPGAAQPRQ